MAKRSKVYLQLLQALVYTRDPKQRWHWQFLYSKEGVTQGDPLSMFAYGIGLLPLIRALVQFPEMDQTWYADRCSAGGKFDAIKRHFEKLEEIGPNYGYFPEPSKHLDRVQENLQLRWKL
jgi:hypothetical protein